MAAIDRTLGLDWSEARYVGDGVYCLDATDRQGVPSVAIRTDRYIGGQEEHHVIVLEDNVLEDFVRMAQNMMAYWSEVRRVKREERNK